MDGYRFLRLFLVVVGLTVAGGAGCPRMVHQYTSPAPRVLPPSPTLEQVIEVVNRNTSRIQSFSTDYATITSPGTPTLRASVAMERPRRFRLRAQTALTGPEVDLGSNDELFWFWIRRNEPRAVYFCRHEQFADSRLRRTIPISPDQLIEALGLVEFDPALPHQGPIVRPDGRLEIRTIRETAEGPTTKVTVVDAASGWVVEQRVYDPRGQLVACATAGQHRRDPLTGLVMPKTVRIRCPAAQFEMRIDLGNVRINTLDGTGLDGTGLDGTGAERWRMPSYEGYPMVDLSDSGSQFTPASTGDLQPPQSPPPHQAWNRIPY